MIVLSIVMGIIGGLLVKTLFLKDSSVVYDAVFGVIGALVAYYLYTSLTADVTRALFTLGAAVVIAGILHFAWDRFSKAA